MLIAKMGLNEEDLPESDSEAKKMVLLVGGLQVYGFKKGTSRHLINNMIGDHTLDTYSEVCISLAHDLKLLSKSI